MKFENTKVFNFEGALRGMRNPLDSWKKSDSSFGMFSWEPDDNAWEIAEAYYGNKDWRNSEDDEEIATAETEIDEIQQWLIDQGVQYDNNSDMGTWTFIGPNDMNLAQRLIRGGPEHRKFLRQIAVSVDITAPFYWWKEFDTYKVGTVANSCSTMHKLTSYPISYENFEMEDFNGDLNPYEGNALNPGTTVKTIWDNLLVDCENLRRIYLETKDVRYWKELVRILPSGWLQKRTVTLNYENLRAMYSQRKNHKLTEWHDFCNWVKALPYAEDLILYGLPGEEVASD